MVCSPVLKDSKPCAASPLGVVWAVASAYFCRGWAPGCGGVCTFCFDQKQLALKGRGNAHALMPGAVPGLRPSCCVALVPPCRLGAWGDPWSWGWRCLGHWCPCLLESFSPPAPARWTRCWEEPACLGESRAHSLPLPQPWGPASMPRHWQRGLLASESPKAPATHPTPSSQGPHASEAAVSGSGPDRHCQPPVLAVGTSSTSPRRAGPWLLNPAPSVPHTSQGQPRRGHPLPCPQLTQVTGPGRWPPWERLDAALSPFQPLLPHWRTQAPPTPRLLVSCHVVGGDQPLRP